MGGSQPLSVTHVSPRYSNIYTARLQTVNMRCDLRYPPAEQVPLVARSVTPPSPSGRGGTALLLQRAPRSCTVFVMTPPNEHSSEGGRDDRGVPYHAESTLSSAQVLKMIEMLTENRQWPLSVSADVAAARLCRGGCCAHAAAPLSRETAGDAARGRRTLRSSDRPRRGVRGAARRSASASALLSPCTVSLWRCCCW